MEVAKLSAFIGAAGRIVFRVEVNDEWVPLKCGKPEQLAACSRQLEIRQGSTGHVN